MINQEYLLKHTELFQYAIGITYKQFEVLLLKFSIELRQEEHKKAYAKPRIRFPGAGRKPILRTDRQKLFSTLLYYKVYPTFRFAQLIFNLDKRNVQLWMIFLEKVLFNALGYELKLPIRKIKCLDQWIEVCPKLQEFLVDATEREIQRPKDNIKQKDYYSGKRKKHTVKNQIIVSPKTRKILAVSKTIQGRIHDKKLFENDPLFLKFPKGATGCADLGYDGTQKLHPYLKMLIPKKKPPGKELSSEDRNNNKAISSVRVLAEHPIAYLKHFNILSQRLRSRAYREDLPIQTIASLYNFTRDNH